jgi:DNA repair protein RecO (recombination protein O)
MAIEKSEALILRVIPFRDTSKVVTAYTLERGLISLLAKGVRGAKPRFGAALELFAQSDLVYYHRESRELQLLAQAALLDPHLSLSGEPRRYAYGVAVLEFLLRALGGEEAPGRLYPLSIRTLEVLGSAPAERLPVVFRAFELKAASFLGHRPELYACVECGRTLEVEEGCAFSPRLGGMICGDCEGKVTDAIPLPAATWGVARRLLGATLAEVEETAWGAREVTGLGRLLEAFLGAQLERYEPLRALRMADTLAAAVTEGGTRRGA